VRRVTGTLLRYGATFAAGVLAAFLVLRAQAAPPTPSRAPTPVEIAQPVPAPAPMPETVSVSYSPRRIR
jgi:hypothetical protein